jgi:hypothetical protein
MKLSTILSTTLAAVMLGTSVTPALAQGKGNKNGHYKNGKAYGQHQSQRGKNNDDRWRRDQNRDWDRNRNSDWERERARREAEERRRRESERWRNDWDRNRSSNYDLDRLSDRRQQTKNEWRNIALVSGGVALLGLLQKDNRLVFAGSAGALYSLYRYEQDRKSQSSIDRLRASYFSRDYFYRDGRRYDRRLVNQNGQRYYQFVGR